MPDNFFEPIEPKNDFFQEFSKPIPKIKPIVVYDPNDPRLRAYQDSSDLYQGTLARREFDYQYGEPRVSGAWVTTKEEKEARGLKNFDHSFNIPRKNIGGYLSYVKRHPEVYGDIQDSDIYRVKPQRTGHADSWWLGEESEKIQPTHYRVTRGTLYDNNGQLDKSTSIKITPEFAKPVQPVIYKPKPKVTNFEQRIQKPTQVINNKDGTVSTHKMMSFEADGKYYAAPTIVEKDGKLVELSQKEAVDYAMKTGEFKEFKTEKEAREYAEGGYKKGTKLEELKAPEKQKTSEKMEDKKFYQGLAFMRKYKLRPGWYSDEELENALKK